MSYFSYKKIGISSVVLGTLFGFSSMSLQSTSFQLTTMMPIYSEGDPVNGYKVISDHTDFKTKPNNQAIRLPIPAKKHEPSSREIANHTKTINKNSYQAVNYQAAKKTLTPHAPVVYHQTQPNQLKIISQNNYHSKRIAFQNPVTIIPNYLTYQKSFSRNYVASVNAGIRPQQNDQAVAYRTSVPDEGVKMLKPIYEYFSD